MNNVRCNRPNTPNSEDTSHASASGEEDQDRSQDTHPRPDASPTLTDKQHCIDITIKTTVALYTLLFHLPSSLHPTFCSISQNNHSFYFLCFFPPKSYSGHLNPFLNLHFLPLLFHSSFLPFFLILQSASPLHYCFLLTFHPLLLSLSPVAPFLTSPFPFLYQFLTML